MKSFFFSFIILQLTIANTSAQNSECNVALNSSDTSLTYSNRMLTIGLVNYFTYAGSRQLVDFNSFSSRQYHSDFKCLEPFGKGILLKKIETKDPIYPMLAWTTMPIDPTEIFMINSAPYLRTGPFLVSNRMPAPTFKDLFRKRD